MSSLGFSIQKGNVARRPADIRLARQQASDRNFIACMIGIGLAMLAVVVFHEQARLLVARVMAHF